MKKQPLSRFMTVRIADSLHGEFSQKSQKYGGTSYVLREMITAFVDNRLSIKQPKLTKESLYDNRKQS